MKRIAWDFNAKTGREQRKYPNNAGKYGKGDIYSNDKAQLEFCNRQSLILTNILFQHETAHMSTWESTANRVDRGRKNQYQDLDTGLLHSLPMGCWGL